MRFGLSLMLMGWCMLGVADAEEPAPAWKRVTLPTAETAVVAVAAGAADGRRIVAATSHGVLESSDEGTTWTARFQTPRAARITDLAVVPGSRTAILAATERGVYGSTDGLRWGRLFGGVGQAQRCTRLAVHPMNPALVVLGTEDGLFVSKDHGRHWAACLLPFAARHVMDAAFAPDDADRVYLTTTDGMYAGQISSGRWERRLGLHHAEAPGVEGPDVVDVQTAEEPGLLHRLSALATDPARPQTLYVASQRGMQVSQDRGMSWESMADPGQPRAVSRLLLVRRSPMALYAATAEGIARYDAVPGAWSWVAPGVLRPQVHALTASQTYLWAATDDGLLRLQLQLEPLSGASLPSPHELLSNFSHEPTIAAARDAAIRYAEVHPDKLKWWRRQSALQALLPKFDVGFDNKRSRDVHFDEGTFPKFQLVETENRDHGLDFSVNWDLGELLWNDQTAIDARSKLLVELRQDIVDEVTRVYFERRRLQIGALLDPPATPQALAEQELRIQELTARLDGLTGGYFSQHVWTGPNPKETAWKP